LEPKSRLNMAEPHHNQAPGIFAFKHLTFALCYPFIRKIKIEREASEAGLSSSSSYIYTVRLPRWLSGKEFASQCKETLV